MLERLLINSSGLILLMLMSSACSFNDGRSNPIETVDAAGASFPARLYQRWFYDLSEEGIFVNYKSVGSGAGLKLFKRGSTDFGATDIKIDDKELINNIIQFPATAGGIAVVYNNKDCPLNLTHKELAGIFTGKIKNYDVFGCKSKKIQLIARSDSSGTTYNFTSYLSSISDVWKESNGKNKKFKFYNAIEKVGTEGVLLALKQNDGGISYVNAASVPRELEKAKLENQYGIFTEPTKASMSVGLQYLNNDNTNSSLPKNGYPLVNVTWIYAKKDGNLFKLNSIKKVFDFMLSDESQKQAEKLGYVELPQKLLVKSRKELNTLKF